MEISYAKKFIRIGYNEGVLFISKDLQTILDRFGDVNGTFAVFETETGEQLFEIDLTYDGEPFVWKRFMHIDSFMKFYEFWKKIEL